MKKLPLIAAMLLMCCITRAQDNPVANPEAIVVAGNARFTVLTSRLVRMEWAEDGIFEDRATLAVVNRRLDVPDFKVRYSGNTLTIKTKDITLRYVGNAPFDSTNLSVSFMLEGKGKPQKVVWRPGSDDSGNLLGTTRTLDGFDASKDKPLENGVVSRDGWAVVDESGRHLLVPVESDWKQWVAERPAGERQDLYLFAYGHDYLAAVSDFAKIGGRIPLPPRYAFGYWWSRYWQYSDFEFVDLAEQMRGFGIPIDVMVLDMDWHDTYGLTSKNPRKDDLGQRVGWTGYTWHKGLFPNAANHLADLHNLGLKTTLNLHPASGIRPYEDKYESFVSDYLSRTDDYDGPKGYVNPDGTPQYVPFRIDQMEWADAYFNSIIRPLEREGVDFWWLDWQQWKTSKYTDGLSNTFWLNHTFFNDMVRQGLSEGKYARRPIIYHRWGGLGSHRYQVAFSGDTYAKWEVLAYLPWFTATSSNVGFGYWGHDIGGHYQKKGGTSTDPELYTRWLQSAVFSPIFKTHANKNTTMEKRFWMFPEYFDDMRDAIRLRYTLSPYIYRSAREAYDTGISICRPMYYYWPEDARAYDCKEQFFFGPDILAASVCTPVDSVTALATRVVWFPEGSDWYDMATGQMYRGDRTDTLRYTIHETPWFVRAGSIIPMASPEITNLQQDNNEIWLCVAPGDGRSETELYEDDGITQAYESEWATTRVSKESSARTLSLTVEPRSGSYRGMDPDRTVRIVLESVPAPVSVKLGNRQIPYSRFAQAQAQASAQPQARAQAPVPAYAQSQSPAYAQSQSQSPVQASSAAEDHLCAADAVWGYSGKDLSVVIYLPEMPADEQIELTVTYSDESAETRELFYGKKGIIHRFMELTPEVKLEYARKVDICLQLPMPFLTFSQCGSFITEDPYGAVRYIEALDAEALKAELDSRPKLSEEFKHKVLEQAKL